MADKLDDISKKLAENTKAINRLSARVVDSAVPSFADLLTEREIGQLEQLIAHRGDLQAFADGAVERDPELLGMYMQFADANIIDCQIMLGGQVVWDSVDPKAEWIVQRHRELRREAEDRKRELRNQRIVGYVMRLESAVVGVVLGWVLGRL